jgi:hypothetical protein
LLEVLRHSATSRPTHRAADLADIVAAQLTMPTAAATLAALTWWYALLSWGLPRHDRRSSPHPARRPHPYQPI